MNPRLKRLTLITPEFAPQPGGLADHSAILANALAEAGVDVTLLAPGLLGRPQPANYRLVELPGHYGPKALWQLRRHIAAANSADAPVLLQYVPHGFGLKGMNLPLVLLLTGQVRTLWTLFHEVNFPMEDAVNPAQRLLAAMQYLMARRLAASSQRLLLATSAWHQRLLQLGATKTLEELPIFSNIPPLAADTAQALNPMPCRPDETRLAHFGTFGPAISEMLMAVLPPLLAKSGSRSLLLLGRGAQKFSERLQREHSVPPQQLLAIDNASAEQIAAGLASAQLVIQPYPDGATTRRGSLLAALAQGCAVLSTDGFLTEPFWRGVEGIRLVPAADMGALRAAAEALLAEPATLRALGSAAAALYAGRFSPERNVATLMAGAA